MASGKFIGCAVCTNKGTIAHSEHFHVNYSICSWNKDKLCFTVDC